MSARANSRAELPHTRHVLAGSARFAQVLREADPSAPVPSCPDWTALDLARHLTEVHQFWTAVLTTGALTDEQIEAIEGAKPELPDQLGPVLDVLAAATKALVAEIDAADPDQPAWTWFEADQSAGFTRRMQAHEATVHRVDAEQAAGLAISPVEEDLALDGIDHVIGVMMGLPDWVTLDLTGALTLQVTPATGSGEPVEIQTLTGRWYGTGPVSGKEFDEPALVLAHTQPEIDTAGLPHAILTGTAQEHYLYLWGRTPSPARQGDPEVLAVLDAAVAAGID